MTSVVIKYSVFVTLSVLMDLFFTVTTQISIRVRSIRRVCIHHLIMTPLCMKILMKCEPVQPLDSQYVLGFLSVSLFAL